MDILLKDRESLLDKLAHIEDSIKAIGVLIGEPVQIEAVEWQQQIVEGTIYERCVKYFVDNKNTPSSNMEIRRAIGASRGAVAMVLYNTYKTSFVKLPDDGSIRAKWMLADAIYSEHAESA